ncbi:P27 family phage terminase small subunit [Streptomyces sp. NPDC008121]|uniref:P27 family phage terminase small subunit n=1 Tax=Streptomyces sp. NPDC008121 TaxID=3364809 RepID=UPI0036EB6641
MIREGNPGKRPVPQSAAVPPSELTEPDWRETFRSVNDPKREFVNARCRAVASREWQRVVPVLKLAVGLGEVDTTVLKDSCISAARIDQCERELSENGLLVRGERGWQKNGATTIVGPVPGTTRTIRTGVGPFAERPNRHHGPRARP